MGFIKLSQNVADKMGIFWAGARKQITSPRLITRVGQSHIGHHEKKINRFAFQNQNHNQQDKDEDKKPKKNKKGYLLAALLAGFGAISLDIANSGSNCKVLCKAPTPPPEPEEIPIDIVIEEQMEVDSSDDSEDELIPDPPPAFFGHILNEDYEAEQAFLNQQPVQEDPPQQPPGPYPPFPYDNLNAFEAAVNQLTGCYGAIESNGLALLKERSFWEPTGDVLFLRELTNTAAPRPEEIDIDYIRFIMEKTQEAYSRPEYDIDPLSPEDFDYIMGYFETELENKIGIFRVIVTLHYSQNPEDPQNINW